MEKMNIKIGMSTSSLPFEFVNQRGDAGVKRAGLGDDAEEAAQDHDEQAHADGVLEAKHGRSEHLGERRTLDAFDAASGHEYDSRQNHEDDEQDGERGKRPLFFLPFSAAAMVIPHIEWLTKTPGAVRLSSRFRGPRYRTMSSYRSDEQLLQGGVHDGLDGVHAVLDLEDSDCWTEHRVLHFHLGDAEKAWRCPRRVVEGRQAVQDMAVDLAAGHFGHGRVSADGVLTPRRARPWTPTSV